jgi:hypothetical protein
MRLSWNEVRVRAAAYNLGIFRRGRNMKIAPDLESYTLFLVLVVPGLISMHVYRLLSSFRSERD